MLSKRTSRWRAMGSAAAHWYGFVPTWYKALVCSWLSFTLGLNL